MYDHETMLDTATLELEIAQAKEINEYVESIDSDVKSHEWGYKSNVTADEMFIMTVPILKGMGLSVMQLYEVRDSLSDSLSQCEENFLNCTTKIENIKQYFLTVKVDDDFQSDLEQKQQLMEEDLTFIAEICDKVMEDVKSLFLMVDTYKEWSHILLTRAQMIFENYKNQDEANRHLSRSGTINFTAAQYNYSLMQNLTSIIHTIHYNLTSEENEYL